MSDPIHIYLVLWITLVIGIIIGVYSDTRLWAFVLWALVVAGGGTLVLIFMIGYTLKGMGVLP